MDYGVRIICEICDHLSYDVQISDDKIKITYN